MDNKKIGPDGHCKHEVNGWCEHFGFCEHKSSTKDPDGDIGYFCELEL